MSERSGGAAAHKQIISGRSLVWRAALAAAVTVVITAGLVWWIESSAVPADRQISAVLDAVKIGLSVGGGIGGIFALYLAWRRQQFTESDAAARRVTELYTKAIEQIGSDKAAVRLGGLYALERLAQDNVEQRQTIVNVLCAYLRMPFTVPEEPAETADIHRERVEEREVRLAAQRILGYHLVPGDIEAPRSTFWKDMHLDFTGAVLIEFNLYKCDFFSVNYDQATFIGTSGFIHVNFGYATFNEARFTGDAIIIDSTSLGSAEFEDCRFDGHALFDRTVFEGEAVFTGARFSGAYDEEYRSGTSFADVTFSGETRFERCTFEDTVRFNGSAFQGETTFTDAIFRKDVTLDNTTFTGSTPSELTAQE